MVPRDPGQGHPMPLHHRPRSTGAPVRWAALVLTLAALVLAGCGDGDDTDAQVGPGVTGFVGATLDDVPVPPLAEPLGPVRETDDGIRVRSWSVRDRSVEEVMAFYQELFEDRPVVDDVSDAPGAGTVLRGEWRLEDGIMRVTVQEAPTVGDEGPTVQLSLQLTPER